MPDITQLVPGKAAAATPQRLPVRAIVASPPASLDAPTMRIVVPSYTTDYDHECRWDHQADALPVAGADCLIVWDEAGAGVVVWWASPASSSRFIGEIAISAMAAPPAGWLLCDGSAVTASTALRAALLAASSPYGVSGSDPKLPDLRGAFPLGVSGSHALGSTGGEETHTLTIAEMPSHDHPPLSPTTNFIGNGTPFVVDTSTGSGIGTVAATGLRGGGGAHNNLPPFVALHHIIYAGA